MGAEDRYISDSGEVSLAQAFTVEHHEIDAGIERYLADTDADPVRRAEPLLSAMKALRRHIYLEEEIVFPHLQQGTLMMPLMVMRKEHGQLCSGSMRLWTRCKTRPVSLLRWKKSARRSFNCWIGTTKRKSRSFILIWMRI